MTVWKKTDNRVKLGVGKVQSFIAWNRIVKFRFVLKNKTRKFDSGNVASVF